MGDYTWQTVKALGQLPTKLVGEKVQRVEDAGTVKALRKAKWRAHHPTLHQMLDSRYQVARLAAATKSLIRRVLPPAMYDWLSLHWESARASLSSNTSG